MEKETLDLITNMIQIDREFRGSFGSTYGGRRDMYGVLGYPTVLNYEHYEGMYQRQDIASRVVRFPSEETWSIAPLIFDGKAPPLQSEELESTPFEKEWKLFAQNYNIWPLLAEADSVAGIGHFGIIVINVDGDKYEDELTKINLEKLNLFSMFSEGDVTNVEYEVNKTSPRYGLPTYYNVQRWTEQSTDKSNKRQDSVKIHYSRVIHIAENSKDGVIGVPRLRGIFNRMIDLEKLSGGGAEATWKLMNKGYALDVSPEYELSEEDEEKIINQIGEFDQGLRRFLLTRGVGVSDLGSDVVDPTGMYNVILDLISATSGIPRRILVGSERGELASSQDERNWARTISSRQLRFAEPVILRPLIDRMIYFGVIPVPTDDFYDIRWKSIMLVTPHEEARIVASVSAAITSVAQATNIITPQEFRSKYLNLPSDPEEGFGELNESQSEGGSSATAGGFISAPTSGRKPGPTVDDTPGQSNEMFNARVAVEALFRTIGSDYDGD